MSLLRTRRRRVTFGLFGPSSRNPVSVPSPSASFWTEESVVLEMADGAVDAEEAILTEIAARLSREALSDPRLRALASEEELATRVSDAVTALWTGSKVKSFVPVLVMRRVREELGIPEEESPL